MSLSHKVEVSSNPNSTLACYKLLFKGYEIGSLLQSPTSNCQLNTYRAFKSVLEYNITFSEFRDKYFQLTDDSRRIMLVDINKGYVSKCKEWCGEDRILGELPYTSTNKSEMSILLIKMD